MKEAREKVFRKNLGLMKAAFAGKSKCGFSVQYYCLPQRRVNDFPPMTNANTDAINLKKQQLTGQPKDEPECLPDEPNRQPEK